MTAWSRGAKQQEETPVACQHLSTALLSASWQCTDSSLRTLGDCFSVSIPTCSLCLPRKWSHSNFWGFEAGLLAPIRVSSLPRKKDLRLLQHEWTKGLKGRRLLPPLWQKGEGVSPVLGKEGIHFTNKERVRDFKVP